MPAKSCTLEGCSRPHYGRGFCHKHYARWRRHGDPLATPRFDPMSKVAQGAPDECWRWTKSHDRDGYAVTKINGRQWRVARWVLTQKIGRDLEADEVTRHTCDNPPCCNPTHLLVGTVADNAADMVTRGRHAPPCVSMPGTRNPAARLTDDQVRTIRNSYARGATQVSLAAEFGVSQPLISQIVRRAVWAHID